MLESETKVHKYFIQQKRKLINKFGRVALNTDQINKECSRLFKQKYKGCFPQDGNFRLKSGYYIINTAIKTQTYGHWISMVLRGKKAYIYDSFGRKTKHITKHLYKRLIDSGFSIINADNDQEQKGLSLVCGDISIAWLSCVKKYGIKKALTI